MLLNYLYLNGPSIFGFWEGRSIESVCSALTSVDIEVWRLLPASCEALVERKVRAIEVFGAYTLAVWLVVGSLLPSIAACGAHGKHRHGLVGAPCLNLSKRDVAAPALPAR